MTTGATAATQRHHDAFVDAGALGCGDLVLELKRRFEPLAPGTVIKVRALDAGAPADIPAWCRMTGHTLVHVDAGASSYWIARRP